MVGDEAGRRGSSVPISYEMNTHLPQKALLQGLANPLQVKIELCRILEFIFVHDVSPQTAIIEEVQIRRVKCEAGAEVE